MDEKGLFYYRLNLVLFLINIGIGVHLKNYLIVITSLIAVGLSVYVFNNDWNKTWLLDQIAILAILIPAMVLWIQLNPTKHPFAGIFFGAAAFIYGIGLVKKLYTHSNKPAVREFWHLFVHILSFVGALFSSEILLIGLV
jgi:hypothetical protein